MEEQRKAREVAREDGRTTQNKADGKVIPGGRAQGSGLGQSGAEAHGRPRQRQAVPSSPGAEHNGPGSDTEQTRKVRSVTFEANRTFDGSCLTRTRDNSRDNRAGSGESSNGKEGTVLSRDQEIVQRLQTSQHRQVLHFDPRQSRRQNLSTVRQ